MRAFALDAFGQPGSIHDLAEPEPAEGHVRVRVAAAALNPFDNVVLQGYLKDKMEHRFPLIPAGDFSGTVEALGSGVHGFSVGDPVFGVTGKMFFGEGTLAEKTTASAGTIAKRPLSISDVEAAALPLAGVSALMCVDAAAPKAKDVVVVVGASGGIGSYAVQIAKVRGAHVIGVTHTANIEYVKGLGADEVVDRTAGDLVDAIKSKHSHGVTAIIDTASDAAALAALSEALRKGGTVISMKGAAAPDELAKRGLRGVNIQTQVNTERLETLAKLSADGKLKAPRIHKFPLDKAGEAFKLLGQTDGKLVVTV
ncbi:MAG TPA: NADP-dependent oxidoreductase [Candidatus Dormibacteraeota bacterium]|jgi:NADPH:quinone reductase-like Zn-dependent oxidoreductase